MPEREIQLPQSYTLVRKSHVPPIIAFQNHLENPLFSSNCLVPRFAVSVALSLDLPGECHASALALHSNYVHFDLGQARRDSCPPSVSRLERQHVMVSCKRGGRVSACREMSWAFWSWRTRVIWLCEDLLAGAIRCGETLQHCESGDQWIHLAWALRERDTFSQTFKEKCLSEVVVIGSIIIFHLSKLWKAKFFVLCDVIFLARLQGKFEIYHYWEWKD